MMSFFSGCNILVFLFLFFFFGTTSMAQSDHMPSWTRDEMVQLAGYGEDKLSNVLVTGTILCETCFHSQDQLHTSPISGASVVVKCDDKRRSGWVGTAVTDEYGDFIVDIPSYLHSISNLDKICVVKVLRVPKNSNCKPVYVKKQKRLKLSSVGNGIRTYSAGWIRFQQLGSKSIQGCKRKVNNDVHYAW